MTFFFLIHKSNFTETKLHNDERINNYKKSLKELYILLKIEIDFQNGDLNLEEMNDRFMEKTNNFSQKFSDPNTINIEVEVSESNTNVP